MINVENGSISITPFEVRPCQDDVFELFGDLDADTVPQLLSTVGELRPVAIDFTNCQFLGSSGLAALLRIRGDDISNLTLQNPTPFIERLLEISGLEGHFLINRSEPAQDQDHRPSGQT